MTRMAGITCTSTLKLICVQVVDDSKGPMTRKDYDIFAAPAGDALFGRVVNYFGFERQATAGASSGPAPPLGFDKTRPLINQQVDMQGREQITECLLTGVKVRCTQLRVVGGKGNTLSVDFHLSSKDVA